MLVLKVPAGAGSQHHTHSRHLHYPAHSQEVGDKVNLGAGGQPPPSAQDRRLGRVAQEVPAAPAAGCSADDAPGHSSLSIHRGAMESTRDGIGR